MQLFPQHDNPQYQGHRRFRRRKGAIIRHYVRCACIALYPSLAKSALQLLCEFGVILEVSGMTYSILLFVTRKPTLSTEEFKDYWENKHIPLLQSLTGPHFPLRCTRRYLARIERQGFGGPANRDHPLLVLRGNLDEFDYDAVAELRWEDEKAFHEFYKTIWQSEAAAKLAADEENFLDVARFKAVVVGETLETRRWPKDEEK